MQNSLIATALAAALLAGCTTAGTAGQNSTTTNQAALARADETRGRQAQDSQDSHSARPGENADPAVSDGTGPSASGNALDQADKAFVLQAAAGSSQEVELGKLAARQGGSSVKPFAQQMVEDHSLANNELKTVARQFGVELPPPASPELARLSQKSGAAFDAEYAKVMVADHEKTVALFEKQSEHGSEPTLRKWALTKLPTLRHHLEMARSLK